MLKYIRDLLTGGFVMYFGWIILYLFIKQNIDNNDFNHVFGAILIFWVWISVTYLAFPLSQKIVNTYTETKKVITNKFYKKVFYE